MNPHLQKALHKDSISLNSALWVILLTFPLIRGTKESSNFLANNSFDWINESTQISFPEESTSENYFEKLFSVSDATMQPTTTAKTSNAEKNRGCHYHKSSGRLICSGSIDFSYLETVKTEEITEFLVQGYEEVAKAKYSYSSAKLQPNTYGKLIGELQLNNTGIKIRIIVKIDPEPYSNTFVLSGEAFSRKVVTIAWKLNGHFDYPKKNQLFFEIGTGQGWYNNDWRSGGTFIPIERIGDAEQWQVQGIIKPGGLERGALGHFKGPIFKSKIKGESRFFGKLQLTGGGMEGTLFLKASSYKNKEITIPQSAFSDMSIKSIVFNESTFYNDFDKDSFKGLKGVESIFFLNSKLELMPSLNILFEDLSSLKEIYIEDCVTPNLNFGLNSNLRNVERLSFKGSGPLTLDYQSFYWLQKSNLTYLDLRNSHVNISKSGSLVLSRVGKTLRYLDISYSTLTDETEIRIMTSCTNITHLTAEGLGFKTIPAFGLSAIDHSLQYLSLRGNDFKKNIGKGLFTNVLRFPYLRELRELNLMECQINFIEKGAFDLLHKLKILHLSYNNLENLQDGWLKLNPLITHLDLCHNQQISSFSPNNVNSLDLKKFKKLQVLDMSNGVFTDINSAIMSLGSNVKNLSIRNVRLGDVPPNIFENLTGLETLDMSNNRDIRGGQLPFMELFKSLKNLKSLYLKQCRISSVNIFPGDHVVYRPPNSESYTLENLEVLDLSGNSIKILDSTLLKLFPNIKNLNLSGNSITTWKTSFFNISKNLEEVCLDENKIEVITADMMSDIKNLKTVKLGNNPFVCGSYVYEILKIIKSSKNSRLQQTFYQYGKSIKDIYYSDSKELEGHDLVIEIPETEKVFHEFIEKKVKNYSDPKQVQIIDWEDNKYVCFSWSQYKFIPFSLLNETFEVIQNKNETRDIVLLWLPALAVVGVVVTVVIIFWKFLDIHLITRAVRDAVALSFLNKGDKEPIKYEYNVFVSYSDKDRSWVVDNLLPRLESWSDVKVCLHERDFQVGVSILENIIASIDSSKNIILILSQAFLKSQWCQYEMHLAQHRLLEKGRDQLIIIFLEHIPLIKRPKTLRYLMMTKTYLEWPLNSKNNSEIELFWGRLRKSLSKLN